MFNEKPPFEVRAGQLKYVVMTDGTAIVFDKKECHRDKVKEYQNFNPASKAAAAGFIKYMQSDETIKFRVISNWVSHSLGMGPIPDQDGISIQNCYPFTEYLGPYEDLNPSPYRA